jgi:hypothetical protein
VTVDGGLRGWMSSPAAASPRSKAMIFPTLARRGKGQAQSGREPAALVNAHHRATALRVAAILRRLGGLPCPRDPRRYEFRSRTARDRAMTAARQRHGWTCVEPDDARLPAHAGAPR